MLLTNPMMLDPKIKRKNALAKCYSLLIRLAEQNENLTVDSGNLGRETLSTAERKDSNTEKESIHE